MKLIVAFCKNRGIGYKNLLPWNIKNDLKNFANLTKTTSNNKKNAVIMGKNTYLSLPTNMSYLKKRDNFIISSSIKKDDIIDGDIVKTFPSMIDLLDYYELKKDIYETIWIIGGYEIYKLFIEAHNNKVITIDEMRITYIEYEYECDTYFPKLELNNDNYFYVDTYFIEKETYKSKEYNVYYITYKNRSNIDMEFYKSICTEYEKSTEDEKCIKNKIKIMLEKIIYI